MPIARNGYVCSVKWADVGRAMSNADVDAIRHLAGAGNYVVVQRTERNYPVVAIQGHRAERGYLELRRCRTS